MKTKLLFTFLLVFSSFFLMAQMPVATLEHNGQSSVFYGSDAFIDAYNSSVNGDTVLLSTGAFNAPSSIEKGISVIGAGYRQDSVSQGVNTVILNYIRFFEGSNNSHIEGILTNSVNYNDTLENITIRRCQIGTVNIASTCYTSFCFITECVITDKIDLNGSGGTGFLIKQNIFYSNGGYFIYDSDGIVVDNNVFIVDGSNTSYAYFLYNCSASLIRNNVFIHIASSFFYPISNLGYNIFYNNLTNRDSTAFGAEYTGSNNYFSVPVEDIFTQTIEEDAYITNNFHLQYPGLYIGTDTTEVGLYGTAIPFKENRFPSNPIITSSEVPFQLDGSGHLNVSFTVEAQEK